MKHNLIKKIFLSLICVVLVALPILFIDSKPVEVAALTDYTTQFIDLIATEDINSFCSYVTTNEATIKSKISDFEVKYAIAHGEKLLETYVADQNAIITAADEIINNTSSTSAAKAEAESNKEAAEALIDAATTAFNDENNGVKAKLNSFYQDTCLPAVPVIPAGQTSVTYEIGGSKSQYNGVGDDGFTVSTGQEVTLHITSAMFVFHGPIKVMNGGVLNITLDEKVNADGSILKREIEETLRVGIRLSNDAAAESVYVDGEYNYYYSNLIQSGNTSSTPNNSGYIPVDATDGIVKQYSGELFNVQGGTLNMTGRDGRHIAISGAGQFKFNVNNINSSGQCITFPKDSKVDSSGSADDVESKAPVFVIDDTSDTYDTEVNLNYVDVNYNNNSTKTGSGISGAQIAGAFKVDGKVPNVNLTNVSVFQCRSVHSGGFMHSFSSVGGAVTMTDVTVGQCYTDAVNSTEGGTYRTLGGSHCGLTMTRTTFDKNYSKASAGAFLWSAMEAGKLVVTDCLIKNNVSYGGTGGIICMGQMSIEGATTITGNKTVTGSGGGISFTNWGSATPNNSFKLNFDAILELGSEVVISNNSAKAGGGILVNVDYIRTGSSTSDDHLGESYKTVTHYTKADGTDFEMRLVINGATIEGNTAREQGAGVHINKANNCQYISNITMNSGTVQNNSANGMAGAFYLSGSGVDFTMYNGEIKNNKSGTSGGAIALSKGNFTMHNGEISGNQANNFGGAVYVFSGGNASVGGGDISNNKAGVTNPVSGKGQGGGIYVIDGDITVSGGNITDNTAYFEGGGIYLTGEGCTVTMNGGTLSSNVAKTGFGGAAYVYKGSFNVTDATISDNTAEAGGAGAVCVNLGSFTMSGSSVISGNNAVGRGGAIYVLSGSKTENDVTTVYHASFTMNGGTISGNTSSSLGGAVSVDKGDFTIKSGIIENNTAANEGGAVHIIGGSLNGENYVAQFLMEDGTIKDNTTNITAADSGGGAVFVQNGTFTMRKGTLDGNKAPNAAAGAVYVRSGTFTMDDGTVSDNTAAKNGGAIRVLGGDFTMYKGSIIGNSSNSFAGAIDIRDGGSFYMYDGLISENETTGSSGGAIRVEGEGNFEMFGGEISGNTSVASAGAIRMGGGGNFTMHDGKIINNTCNDSGGAIFMKGGTCTIKGGEISGNKKLASVFAGGAIAIDGGGICYFEGGEIKNNISNLKGGAISLSQGSNFYMSGGSITGNTATGVGGAVNVDNGNFTITAGTISGNKSTSASGGAVNVIKGSVTIGVSDCYGDVVGHASCPVITDNSAVNGGAFAISGGNLTIHCGSVTGNSATDEGGAMYVEDGNVTVNYVEMVHNSAADGGGFSIYANTKNLTVTVDSGYIRTNTATDGNGGGIKVSSATGKVATVIIGRQGCDGAAESTHKHPDISDNIASGEGGGLHLVSADANGIVFTMWCGALSSNVAAGNVPTGNILQEGGTVSINGTYSIDNVTVNNGSYLRPELGEKKITIDFQYRFPDGATGVGSATKSITLTVGKGSGDNMSITLPDYRDIVVDTKTYVLLRWSSLEYDDTSNTYDIASKLVINEAAFPDTTTLTLWGVWMVQGAGLSETPFVFAGQAYAHVDSGSQMATGLGLNNFFTVQFGVSECDPAKFDHRYLSFEKPFFEGTVIIMVDLTAENDVNNYYYYAIDGTETEVHLHDFKKLGAPNKTWSSSRVDINNSSKEEFLFIFDLSATDEAFTGGFWISFTRNYVNGDAPMVQRVACAISDENLPSISADATDAKVDDSVTVNYTPGIMADQGSVYYGKEAAIVIEAAAGSLPAEAYALVGNEQYGVTTSGVIIIPISDAKVAGSVSFKLVCPTLANGEKGIDLNLSLYITDDADKPLNCPILSEASVSLMALPLPSVDISMTERIFYVDNLPESVALNVTKELHGIYGMEVTVYRREFGDGNEYTEADNVTVSNDYSSITFNDSIDEGTYRIVIVITNESDEVILTENYNFVILDS